MSIKSCSLRQSARGIALLIVLWMLALLSVIAGSLVFSSRTEILVADNITKLAKAEAAADAGVHKALYELLNSPPTDPARWQGNGQTHSLTLGDARLFITILDESAKIDINTPNEALLRNLFLSQGANESTAESLTDTILDWRDADNFRRLHGAEKEDYFAAGRNYGPANGNFESVEELRQVLGVTDDLYARLEPLITVFSGQSGINSAVASRGVLLALPGASPESVDAYLEQRRSALEQGQVIPVFPPAQPFGAAAINSIVTIQVVAVLEDNTRFLREAVVRLTPVAKEPVAILAWRSPVTMTSESTVLAAMQLLN